MTTMTREGQIIHQDALTQEQIEQAWAIVFRSFLQAHPEVLEPDETRAVMGELRPAQPQRRGSIPAPLSICAQD